MSSVSRMPSGSTQRLLDFICGSSPDVRTALARIARHAVVIDEVLVLRFREDETHGTLDEHVPGVPDCLGKRKNELFVLNTVMHVRAYTGKRVSPERVYLAHRAPKQDAFALARALGTHDIAFGAGSNGVVFARRVLDLPLIVPLVRSEPPPRFPA